jgi:hypothetical protein
LTNPERTCRLGSIVNNRGTPYFRKKLVSSYLHTNKNGAALRVAMAIDAKPPGRFRYQTLLSQWVLFITNVADTKTAAQRRHPRTASIF